MPPTAFDPAAHRAAVEAERLDRVTRLRDPMSWLSLAGLHWLHAGDQSFGSGPDDQIVLRAGAGDVPARAGTVHVVDGRATVDPGPDRALTIAGNPITPGLELADDASDEPTVLELGSLRIVLIRRGQGRIGLRVRDIAAPLLRTFDGLPFFPVDPRWRLVGRLVRSEPGATIPIPDVLGDVNLEPSPGSVEMSVDGATHRLVALESRPGHLWLVFGDATNGAETYGGGRFLVTGPVEDDGTVEVDFNLAYNPPCVFSPYATCPLPPPGNRLPFRIEAGERTWTPPDGSAQAGRSHMQTKNLADLYHLAPVPWSRAIQALEGKQTGNGTSWLATVRPDGRPHLAGVGAIWAEDRVWIVSGPGTRKSQNLAARPECSVGMSFEGMDLVVEGRAERVTDEPTLERIAKRYGDDGWPARVEDGALTYDYSAPSAGPPPWYVYAITPTTVYGVLAEEPGGATRWRFDG